MKELRQGKIKELIEKQIVQTQEELAQLLKEVGIDVTQATVSRDIRELMLIKVPIGDGGSRYAFPTEQGMVLSKARIERVFKDSVTSIVPSENLIIIRTSPGTAQAVAYTIDYVRWAEILGTIAGDDTIFVAAASRKDVERLVDRFQSLLSI